MRKRTFFVVTTVLMVAFVCLGFSACTVTENDPSAVAEEKTELVSLQVKAENNTWHKVSEQDAENLFDMVKSLGELSGEALDVAVSGNSTIETTYDYSFKLAFESGNVFMRKKGEFLYNIGEKFTRTYSDGKVNERYSENKLVVKRSLSKDTATLNESQLGLVRGIFEKINEKVMNEAFEKVAESARASGYSVEEIAQKDLKDVLLQITASGVPNHAEVNLLKGYRIISRYGEDYVFFTASAKWASELEQWSGVDRVGRVCIVAGSYANEIKLILQSD